MPQQETHPRRTLGDDDFKPNPPSPYVEFGLASCFSFLRAASAQVDLTATANVLGYDRIGIADRNTLAGVVRIHTEAAKACIHPLIGARLVLLCGTQLLAYPQDRAAYARLSTLLSLGKMQTSDGAWQTKGETHLTLEMLRDHAEGLHLIVRPPENLDVFEAGLPRLVQTLPDLAYIGATYLYRGDDRARINRLDTLARAYGLAILATNDVLYHAPDRRPLHDVMVAIREGVSVPKAGFLLGVNAERHLKSPAEMCRLFADWPHAIAATRALADRITFQLSDLRYEYPHEIVPTGKTAQTQLEQLTWDGAKTRYPDGIPDHVTALIHKEFALIKSKKIARYFLTVYDIVRFARHEAQPPILCQGRGSAANSAVCFCLGVTSVDPNETSVLFERFLSEARDEPPDIDVDFEHERREEVIQYMYGKYGRHRAGLCATVIHYRPRSAIREVGKAMGLSEDVTSKLAGTIWGSFEGQMDDDRAKEAGLDLSDPYLRIVLKLAKQMIGMPRHLSQHVGGFILTERPLTEIVPIGNGAMPERSFIEWDKDDINALGIFKVDVLALGMLTCIAKCFDLLEAHYDQRFELATVPQDDAATFDMLCEGDSLGVFQVESRAQMAMLPKLRPRVFYDLVIEVAIVRPGPIQGGMVHPYINRRQGKEQVHFPSKELEEVLGKTLGVPLFQEQAMQIAVVAAGFDPAEADQLRRSLATFRRMGTISTFKDRFISGMLERDYDADFAERCFAQIEGFGEYGFPESHAAAFAMLAYVSAWLKCHHPAIFACALLNSQPMGFYAPAQIVRDAREHGVETRPICVNHSEWDNRLERRPDGALALRLGFRQIKGLKEEEAGWIVAARGNGYPTPEALWLRAGLRPDVLTRLAEADTFSNMGLTRRDALWQVKAIRSEKPLPLFNDPIDGESIQEPQVTLPAMHLGEEVVEDYVSTRLSLRAHPMELLRPGIVGLTPHNALIDVPLGRCTVCGLVITRQRPGTASGVIFLTLEDETGVSNVVVWPKIYERFRRIVMGGRLLRITGHLQREGIVVHLIAQNVEDISHKLSELGHPQPEALNVEGLHTDDTPKTARHPTRAMHPRDQAKRLFPSRDFH